MDLASVLGVYAGEHFDERGFACAVLSHQGMDFTLPQGEIHILKGAHTWKVLADAAHFQYCALLHRDTPPFFKIQNTRRG